MIVRYDSAFEPGLDVLRRACSDEGAVQLDRGLWSWQYDQNPSHGAESPAFLFVDPPQVLGLLGTIPVEVWAGGALCRGSWGIDVVSHPDFRNAGIGGYLVMEWDRATPVSLSLGVTNMALEVFQASERVFAGAIPVFKRVLAPRKVLERRFRSKLLANLAGLLVSWRTKRAVHAGSFPPALAFERLDRFGPELDALWERARREYPFAVHRSSSYLAWRFDERPNGSYGLYCVTRDGELVGYVVTNAIDRDGLRMGYIADVFCLREPVLVEFALAKAVEALAAEGADLVECLASHVDYQRALLRTGFFKRPSTTRFLYKVNDPSLVPLFRGADRLDAWHITYADSDCLTVIERTGRAYASP